MQSSVNYNYQEEANIQLVSQNGWLLSTLGKKWKENARVVEAAIRQNGTSIGFAPFFQNNRPMAIIALENTGLAYNYLHPDLRKEKEIKKLANQNLPQKLPSYLGPPQIQAIENTTMVSSHFFFANPGDMYVQQGLEDQLSSLEKQGYYNERIHLNLDFLKHTLYVRDARVSLFSGKQLIPRSPQSFKNWDSKDYKWAMVLPFGSKQISDTPSFMGSGCTPSNTRQAILTCCKYSLPYERATTMIEGGNCFLFMDGKEKKALVGEWSLYFSYYGLKEDGYFDQIDLIDFSTVVPSDSSIRMARNLSIFKQVKKVLQGYAERYEELFNYETQDVDAYFDSLEDKAQKILNNPNLSNETKQQLFNEEIERIQAQRKLEKEEIGNKITSEDQTLHDLTKTLRIYQNMSDLPSSEENKDDFFEQAQLLEARLNITKNKMAEELEIYPENLIFIPQAEFHIDMNLFVTPSGEVILHNSKKTIEFLQSIQTHTILLGESEEFVNAYLATAMTNATLFNEVEEKQERVLQTHNLRYQTLPLTFSFPEVSALNYCNGIFLERGFISHQNSEDKKEPPKRLSSEGYAFLSTGPSFHAEIPVHRKFVELFEKTLGYRFQGVPGMSKQIAINSGGVHCLTFELFKIKE